MNGTVLGLSPEKKGGNRGSLREKEVTSNVNKEVMRDPLRRNLLRKGRFADFF